MGFYVAAHVFTSAPDLAKLEALPGHVAWAVYRDEDARTWFLDAFEPGKKHEWPFTSMPHSKSLPRDLPESLSQLSRVYAGLRKARIADSFDIAFLNLNLLLSKTLQLPVSSVCSDDDGLDFACVSHNGILQRLRCECSDVEIVFRDGKVEIQPVRIQDDDFDLTDLTDLHDPASGISVLERNKDHSSLLHLIAGQELSAFLGTSTPPLGLGRFDGVELPPIKVAASTQPSAEPVRGMPAKPWWKFWAR